MSPAFLTAVADRLFARRWWLLAAAMLAIALLFVALSLAPPHVAFVAAAFAGPTIVVPWALLCACVWFHPQHGKLQPGSKVFGRLPPLLQTGLRWYAAAFLGLFVVAGAVVCPILSVIWL